MVYRRPRAQLTYECRRKIRQSPRQNNEATVMKPCAHWQCTRATAESSNSTSRSAKGKCEVELYVVIWWGSSRVKWLGVGWTMNRVGGQSKYNYRSGTYTTIKFMLLQSKSASRLRIYMNYNEQDLVTTSRKSLPTVNDIHPTMNYTCWRKKGDSMVEQRRPGMGRSTATKIVLTHRKKSC
jgi:hypothetical protein